MNKNELINYLNSYLKISDYPDDNSKNWLQVDNSRQEIKKIWYAVDATSYIFDKAIEKWVDMVICHHGLFWGFDPVVIGTHYDRISKLIKNDIALYGCHLPLDWHEEVGNNIVLLNKFAEIMDIRIPKIEKYEYSFGLRFDDTIKFEDLEKYCDVIWLEKWLYNFWNLDEIRSVYFSSGGWLFHAKFARENNFDLLVTWEWAHYEMSLAKELSQSVLIWWHYETEIFGVQALAEKLNKDFGVEIVFLDEKY